MSLTLAQGRALIRIIEGWDNGQHVTRPDIPTKTRAALFDAGLITIGTMVYPDALHPTDEGRAAAERIIGRLKRDPNSVHEPGSYEWARAREQEAHTDQARHHADTQWGTHPAGTDLVGIEVPTQDQLARAEGALTPETTMTTLIEIPLTDLHPRPENLRTDANGDDLVPSIRAAGILQPLNVTPRPDGGWWINAGHRRLDGAAKAGLMLVPALVDDDLDQAAVTFSMLIENMQRSDLTPIEQARGFERLVGFGVKQKEIAEHVGISPAVVSRRLGLLKLPAAAQEQVHTGELSLEAAERYGRLPEDVMAIAIEQAWPSFRVEQAIEVADTQRLAAELRPVAEGLGLRFFVLADGGHPDGLDVDGEPGFRYVQLWREIEHTFDGDDEPQRLDVERWVEPTAEQLAVAAAMDDVVGVCLETVWEDPAVDQSDNLKLTLIGKKQAPAATTAAGASAGGDGDDDLKARQAERDARIARDKAEADRYRKFVRTVAARKHKGTDVARWAMTYLLSTRRQDVKATAASLLGLPGSDGQRSGADSFDAEVAGASGARLLQIVVATIIADGSDYNFKPPTTWGNGPALNPILEELGWEPAGDVQADETEAA